MKCARPICSILPNPQIDICLVFWWGRQFCEPKLYLHIRGKPSVPNISLFPRSIPLFHWSKYASSWVQVCILPRTKSAYSTGQICSFYGTISTYLKVPSPNPWSQAYLLQQDKIAHSKDTSLAYSMKLNLPLSLVQVCLFTMLSPPIQGCMTVFHKAKTANFMESRPHTHWFKFDYYRGSVHYFSRTSLSLSNIKCAYNMQSTLFHESMFISTLWSLHFHLFNSAYSTDPSMSFPQPSLSIPQAFCLLLRPFITIMVLSPLTSWETSLLS